MLKVKIRRTASASHSQQIKQVKPTRMASATGGWLGRGCRFIGPRRQARSVAKWSVRSREIGGASPSPAGRWWGSRPGQADRFRSAAQWSDWSRLGAKPALQHTQWAGRGLTKTDHSKGATATGLSVDGGVVGGVSQHLLGDMRKPPASPRSGARRAGRRPLERPQATAGWRCSRAESTARRARAARRFLQKPT